MLHLARHGGDAERTKDARRVRNGRTKVVVDGVGVSAMPVDAGRWRSRRQAEMVQYGTIVIDGGSIYSVCVRRMV